ncbi:extracellular solute-binding protein [Paracoccus sp. S-4012]|uniref:ABC transporter substrate-binding protein n=1 Tax=Paracoccus sp. S-4012 TaxID=2665648 RepID=UPI0012AF662D|nr:ABC transporter substrate-binding protein [Paracoccus sp. S-4012]MRX50576.1 extracellular solute-binding protein [Paracoccus sp. S-4012]
MNFKTSLLSGLALAAATGGAALAQGKTLNVLDWGGAYGQSHATAYNAPFTQETGINIVVTDADNPAVPIKAQVEAGNVTADVASVEYADAVRLCDEGALEMIDPAILAPAADGTPAVEDFLEGGVTECFVGTDVWSMVMAYDDSKFPDAKPASPADFFNVADFPGKRTMRKGAKFNLEFALMGDGVPPGEVYDVLSTPEGVDRAFAKLDEIKDNVVWWEAGAQAPQLLADGEATIAYAFNGRIFNAAIGEGKPFNIVWDGQVYEMEGWVVPKGAPNLQNAMDYIAFSTTPERQARAAELISYGPLRASSSALVGNVEGKDIAMGPHLPTAPENLALGIGSDAEFWVDRDAELTERFNAWLAN